MPTNEAKIYTAILIAAILMVLFIVSFVWMLLRHHRNHIRLYKEKLEAEATTLERERRRMANDLHDGFGPLLAGVQLYAGSLQSTIPEDKVLIEKILANIKDALADIHTISNHLLPNVLIRMGLIEGIRDIAKDINRSNKLLVEYKVTLHSTLSTDFTIHVYRIIMEIIANTIKHANAKKLSIVIKERNQVLVLQTRDDGKGYDASRIFIHGSGLGLKNMLSRVELLDGEIFIDTALETGTTYEIEIPIPPYENSKN
jgi:two-component system, NarL family, sensor kinase